MGGADESDVPAAAEHADRPDVTGFSGTIVGLGASAGGLDALDKFFSALPPCPEAAFVVVQHLSPDHRTMMDNLLGRHTAMPVHVVEPDMLVEAGHVYVIAPGKMMVLRGGRLQLTPKPTTGLTLPIDEFFERLAREAGPRAIGIILSGTGSDGTRGAIALNDAGAWVLAQDPASARFDGMPRSVIASGVVDRVLEPAALAAEVAALLDPAHEPRQPRDALYEATYDESALQRTLATLARATRIDFSDYKPATVLRRLQRRLQATECQTLDEYHARLLTDSNEAEVLRHELLIPVTAFFRDREAFDALRDLVLRPLVQAHPGAGGDPIRIWVCATATGEEAYSIAVLLASLIDERGETIPYKIFATDIEPRFLAVASAGRYPASVLESFAPELRRRIHVVGDTVQFDSALRQSIVFARHDALVDAPFTQMDLVSCRNMLIYLRPAAQERVLRRLEQALKLGGVLFLGGSETLLGHGGDFEAVEVRHKLYRLVRRPPPLPPEDLLAAAPGRARRRASTALPQARLIDHAVETLLAQYAPPSLIITATRELVHVFGEGRRYLRIPEGSATLDVLQLLHPALSPVVATLVHAANRDRTEQLSRPLRLEVDGQPQMVQIRVSTLGDEAGVRQLLVSFQTVQTGDAPVPPDLSDFAEQGRQHIADLERELTETRANLQITIQDLGTANEELQATNEELMASNEELQGTNEELQSVNEELNTLNAELQSKIEALNSVNADLEGLTRASQLATVFVDADMRVLRFTPEALPLFHLRESDIGRPLQDLAYTLNYPDLFADLRDALTTRDSHLREVSAQDGRSFLVTVLPYTTPGSHAPKAVATFVDISAVKDAQRIQRVLDALPSHVAVLDRHGVILGVNRAWREFAAANGGSHDGPLGVGANYLATCRASAAADAYAQRAAEGLFEVLEGRRDAFVMTYPCHAPTEERWFLMHIKTLGSIDGGAVVSHLNVTGWLSPQLLLDMPNTGEPPHA